MTRHLENAEDEQGLCLKFVLRSVFEFLPPPRCDRNDQNSLSSLTNLIRQRHQNLVEFLVSGGKSKDRLTPEERRETAERVAEAEKILLSKSFREARVRVGQFTNHVQMPASTTSLQAQIPNDIEDIGRRKFEAA